MTCARMGHGRDLNRSPPRCEVSFSVYLHVSLQIHPGKAWEGPQFLDTAMSMEVSGSAADVMMQPAWFCLGIFC